MTILTIPSYIEKTGIQGKPVRYKWESGGGSQYYDRISVKIKQPMQDMSPRALLALSAGISEWILWRLHNFTTFPDPYQFVEAIWAGVVDFRYAVSDWSTTSHLDLLTPELEPQIDMALLLSEALRDTENRSNRGDTGCYLAFLSQHIVGNNKDYKTWLKFCFSRLNKLYPKNPETRKYHLAASHTVEDKENYDWGVPVPREALDPDFDFKPEMAEELINNYLQKLDYTTNRFLRSPEEMISLGFEGTPYTYSSNE